MDRVLSNKEISSWKIKMPRKNETNRPFKGTWENIIDNAQLNMDIV